LFIWVFVYFFRYTEYMEQHAIPRQITSFEFKLIGFMTIKQFIYLVVFIPLGIITFYIFPVPLLNILLGVAVGSLGFAFAFVPINDRPMDVWIKNMYKRLTSPTQYVFHKHNPPIYLLKNLLFLNDPHRVLTHIESRDKLGAYLAKTKPIQPANNKQSINNLFKFPITNNQSPITKKAPNPKIQNSNPKQTQTSNNQKPTPNNPLQGKQSPITNNEILSVSKAKNPFFSGMIKNHKLIPIPGILIYVKNEAGAVLRLLKTNPHGIFATFNPLPSAEYNFEIKDPKNTYFFDTIKVKIESVNSRPIEIMSKEML
jgi:hypothetical protein